MIVVTYRLDYFENNFVAD